LADVSVGPENSLPPGTAQAHQAALLMRCQTAREVRSAHSTSRTPLPRRMRVAMYVIVSALHFRYGGHRLSKKPSTTALL